MNKISGALISETKGVSLKEFVLDFILLMFNREPILILYRCLRKTFGNLSYPFIMILSPFCLISVTPPPHYDYIILVWSLTPKHRMVESNMTMSLYQLSWLTLQDGVQDPQRYQLSRLHTHQCHRLSNGP